MILNGKALRKFNNWLFKKYIKTHHTLNEIELYAYIIEWFDSVGVFIEIECCIFNDDYGFDSGVNFDNYNNYIKATDFEKTRQEATKQAIIKANEIYNNR